MKKHIVTGTENLLTIPSGLESDVTRSGGVEFRTTEHKFIWWQGGGFELKTSRLQFLIQKALYNK